MLARLSKRRFGCLRAESAPTPGISGLSWATNVDLPAKSRPFPRQVAVHRIVPCSCSTGRRGNHLGRLRPIRGCRHWALTGELGRINATLCELEESFIAAADRAAATLMAEGCASFVATYYRQRYTRSIGSTVTRVEPPGRR